MRASESEGGMKVADFRRWQSRTAIDVGLSRAINKAQSDKYWATKKRTGKHLPHDEALRRLLARKGAP